MEVNATHFMHTDETFSEEDCDASSLDTNITYTFSYNIGKKTTLHLYAAGETLQSKNFKKVDGYEMDITMESFSLHSGSFHTLPETGTTIYYSLRLNDGKLYMQHDGNSIHSGTSEENRTIEISTEYYWTKQ